MPQLNAMEDFQRDVSYRLLKRAENEVALTATLRDRFHDIVVEVVADVETLTIASATVAFNRCPTAECPNVAQRMAGLVGVTIGKGLTRKLMELFGGGEGCGNMRNLLQGLLPLAMNLKACAGITDEREMLDTIHDALRGSCAGYANPPKAGDGQESGGGR